MPKQVDQRIVQMQFDNKKFEQGVQQTLHSINTLDSTLNKLNTVSLKGFEKLGQFANKIDLSAVGSAADIVANRMSAMGVVGATVLQNLTNAAIGTAKHLKDITIGQIMSGGKNRALNIEAAKFQLEGLGVTWEKIEDDINYGVKDTAYGLDEAAKAASQLVASNVRLGDEMKYSLRAISGVAAMTNRSFDDTASIFTTVAGNGRLMGDQLQQLSSRGLNAAATLAKQLGKSEKEIREMVSKGQIDFKTFAKAMDDAFGAHAKDANKTFTGALSNMKASLSRIGAEFYQPGLEYARDVFNAITGAVNTLKASLKDYGIFENVKNIMGALSKNAVAFFESLSDQSTMNRKIGGVLKVISGGLGTISSILNNGLHLEVLKTLGVVFSGVLRIIKAVGAGIKEAFPTSLLIVVDELVKKLQNSVKEFDKNYVIYTQIKTLVAGLASMLKVVWRTVTAVWDVLGKPIFNKLIEQLKELLGWGAEAGKKMKSFADNFNIWAPLYNGVRDLKIKWNESIAEIEDNFKNKFGKSIPETIDTIKEKIASLFKGNEVLKAANKIAETGENPYSILAEKMGKSEEEIHEMIEKGEIDFETFSKIMNEALGEGTIAKKATAIDVLSKAIEVFTKVINTVIDVVSVFYNTLTGGDKGIFDYVSEGIEKLKNAFDVFIAFVTGKDLNVDIAGKLSPGLAEFLTDAKDIFNNFKQIFKDAFKAVKPVIKSFVDILKNLKFDDIVKAGGLTAAIFGINGFIKKLEDLKKRFSITNELNNIENTILGISGSVNDFFGALTDKISGKDDEKDRQIQQVKEIAIAIGILAGSMLVLASIDTNKLDASLATVSVLILELIASLYALDKYIATDGETNLDTLMRVMIGMSASLLILAWALKSVSKIDSDKLGASFLALSGILGELIAAVYGFSVVEKQFQGTDLKKVSVIFVALALAIKKLAAAMVMIAKLDTKGVALGLAGIAGMLSEVLGFAYLLRKEKLDDNLPKIAASLILFAVAINLLVIPLAALALLGAAGGLGASLIGLGLLLTELAAFTAVINDSGAKQFAGVAASLIVLAVAINMLIIPLAAMALMGDKLANAIVGMGFLLGELAIFSAIMSEAGVKEFAGVAASLIVFAVALNLMVIPLSAMALMGDKLEGVMKGLGVLLAGLAVFSYLMRSIGIGQIAGLSVSLVILALGLKLMMEPLTTMAALGDRLVGALTGLGVLLGELAIFSVIVSNGATNFIAVAASLVIFAAALNILMVPLFKMADMDANNLTKAIIAFTAIVALLMIVVGISAALQPFAVGILAVAAAFAVVGFAVMEVGIGVAALGAGVFLLASGLNILVMTAMVAGDALVGLAINAAMAITVFVITLGAAAPQFVTAIANVIIAVCDAILQSSTKIVDTVLVLIVKLLESLKNNVPQMITNLLDLAFGILDGLIKGLTEKIPALARDIYNFFMELLDEVVGLINQTPFDLIDIFFGKGFDPNKNDGKRVGDWFKGLFSKNKDSEEVKEAGEKTAEAVVDSTADQIESKESQDKVNDSLDGLMAGAGEYLNGNTILSDSMEGMSFGALDSMSDAFQIKNGKSQATADIASFASEGFLSEAEDSLPDFFNMGDAQGTEYMKGLRQSTGVNSPSKKTMEIAKYLDEGLAIGFNKSHGAEDALQNKALGLMHIFGTVGDQASKMEIPTDGLLSAFTDADKSPVITPLLDLSHVQQGFSSLDSMFAANRSLQLAGEASYLNDAGKTLNLEIQNGNRNGTNSNINALGTKLDRLGEAILNRQIVLDSGELVGGLVNPMDRTLGVRAIRAQRGGAR